MTLLPQLLTEAAHGGLKPSPTGRLRRVLLHLSYSMALSHLLDTTPPRLLTVAACGRLEPAPDSRLRGTYPHLLHSIAPPFVSAFVAHGRLLKPRPGRAFEQTHARRPRGDCLWASLDMCYGYRGRLGCAKIGEDAMKLLLAAAVAALLPIGAQGQTAQQLTKGASDTKNVLNYGMDYNLQRFSPIDQINKNNVKDLVPVWSYSYDDNRSEESQPLIYNGVLYVTTNSATMAIDAKTGTQIWKAKVDYPPETPRIVCCGIINRGAALFDGKVYRTTLDANVVALDAKTGKEVWKQNVIDFKTGYSMTGAPLVADGVLITGISGAEYGTRLFIDGWDPQTGQHLWRTYTIPGTGEPGNETWPGDTWQHGGGSTWITGSFDPELHTVYWGIGNPGPFNAAVRNGDNLYTDSVLALDPKTGKIKWYYQFSPNDPFDYDSVAEMILAELNVDGKPTKVLIDANRNGFFYVLDRTDGKLLAANPYVNVNWASRVDLETGRPVETEIAARARAGEKVTVFPSLLGGKNWQPMSFNPQKGLAYANQHTEFRRS